jgi:hypothetical protein
VSRGAIEEDAGDVGTQFEGLEEKGAHRELLSTAVAVRAEGNDIGGGWHSGAVLGGRSLMIGALPDGENVVQGWRPRRLEVGLFDNLLAAWCRAEAAME